jgi:hypothetical protein
LNQAGTCWKHGFFLFTWTAMDDGPVRVKV